MQYLLIVGIVFVIKAKFVNENFSVYPHDKPMSWIFYDIFHDFNKIKDEVLTPFLPLYSKDPFEGKK